MEWDCDREMGIKRGHEFLNREGRGRGSSVVVACGGGEGRGRRRAQRMRDERELGHGVGGITNGEHHVSHPRGTAFKFS